jgi:pyridoxine/pyridoxamine 5'-phosphate oxidase
MICPLVKLKDWLDAEKINGNPFPQSAVLSTISKDRAPRSRVVSTLLNEQSNPVFYTSPNSRKFEKRPT